MSYMTWSENEINRLEDVKFPPSVRGFLEGSFETAWTCSHCKNGKAASKTLPGYLPLIQTGVFLRGEKIAIGDGMALPTVVFATALKVLKLRDIFVRYLPEFDCLYCVQCGIVAPWPEVSGMWRKNFMGKLP